MDVEIGAQPEADDVATPEAELGVRLVGWWNISSELMY